MWHWVDLLRNLLLSIVRFKHHHFKWIWPLELLLKKYYTSIKQRQSTNQKKKERKERKKEKRKKKGEKKGGKSKITFPFSFRYQTFIILLCLCKVSSNTKHWHWHHLHTSNLWQCFATISSSRIYGKHQTIASEQESGALSQFPFRCQTLHIWQCHFHYLYAYYNQHPSAYRSFLKHKRLNVDLSN